MSNDFWKGYATACLVAMLGILSVGSIAHCDPLESLIVTEALKQGLDPSVALAIADIESNMNPKAVGPKGEIGLMQILPRYAGVPRIALFDPKINARIGVMKLIEVRDGCPVEKDLTYVICYNQGMNKIPAHPYQHPYYKRFMRAWVLR